ncbi:endospore germination permease [Paenibacillus sp.]|uniref:GerAB/ArcD/ProY family transporter n=1 Tax=Paenibacillus sp. TaxID=58172 RepID=UPI0028120249|nr:endospore germination permease [Paenibacillus sp.]
MQQISKLQANMIAVLFMVSIAIKHPPVPMILAARQDAWMGYIVAGIAVLLPLWLMDAVQRRFPAVPLIEAMLSRRPWIGRGVLLLYGFVFFFTIAHDIRFLVSLVNIYLLPSTPMVVLASTAVFTAVWFVKSGIVVIARASIVLCPLFVILVFLLPALLTGQARLEFLSPVLERPLGVAEASFYAFGHFAELMLMPLLFAQRTFRLADIFPGIAVGIAVTTIMILGELVLFGPDLSTMFWDPPYELIRQLRLTDFLDRLDMPIAAAWIPTVLLKIGITLYFLCQVASVLVPTVNAKSAAAPIGIFALVCVVWFFDSAVQLGESTESRPFLFGTFAFVVPLVLFALLWPKRSARAAP